MKIATYFVQPPQVVNLPGAQLESETVNVERAVMTFTCTDNIDAPLGSISVSPSTNPEFFRLRTLSSVTGSTGR